MSGLAIFQGFGLCFGLIVAIGAQNAMVLSQCIRNQYQWLMAAICIALDIALITAGVLGLGALVTRWPQMLVVFKWGGALFLVWYGLQALRSSFRSESLSQTERVIGSRRKIIGLTLAVTLLNPHVYLDTVVLIGGVGAQLQKPDQYFFLVGAWLASLTWFISLCVAGKLLQPLFAKPKAWQVLYLVVAITMWVIAASLLMF